MTAPTLRADERDAWTRFLHAILTDSHKVAAAEARLRATWAEHERQQGIRR